MAFFYSSACSNNNWMHAIWCTVDGLLDSLVFPSKFHISYSNVGQIIVNFVLFFCTSKLEHGFFCGNWSKIQKKSCTLMRVVGTVCSASQRVKMNESVWCATNEMCWNIAVINAKAMRAMRNHFIFLSFNGCLNPLRFFLLSVFSLCKNDM